MPSPKAFLRDITDYKLDPKVAYTKSSLEHGRVKQNRGVAKPQAEPATAEPVKEEVVVDTKKDASAEKHTPPTHPHHTSHKRNKKAVNANDSVESSVPSDKQEATEESAPATVPELDVVSDV